MDDDPFLGYWSPVAAIVALTTVVAHHKKVARRNRDAFRQIAEFVAARALVHVRLVERLAVDVGAVVPDEQLVAGKADDALDEVVVRPLGRGLGAWMAIGRLARDAALMGVGAGGRLEDDGGAPARGGRGGGGAGFEEA